MIQELESWGVKFQKTPSGDYDVRKVHYKGSYVIGVAAWYGMVGGVLGSGGGGSCGGGGGGGFCGFGGDSGYPFSLPKVEEDVAVGGLTIKLDRTKWGYSVFGDIRDGLLARFVGEDVEVTLRRIAPLAMEGRTLVKDLSAKQDVLYARSIATAGALRGVKAAYGVRQSFGPRAQNAVRYFFAVSNRDWLCFEARSTGKAPQWQDANELILGAKLNRSQS
jgi:hypothetical protein